MYARSRYHPYTIHELDPATVRNANTYWGVEVVRATYRTLGAQGQWSEWKTDGEFYAQNAYDFLDEMPEVYQPTGRSDAINKGVIESALDKQAQGR